MDEYAKLIERLRRIEALHEGAATQGERTAAGEALRRTAERLDKLKPPPAPATEFRFTLDNSWSRKLFLALLRRSGHSPYRYRRQRHTTVMVRLQPSVADALWAEFNSLDEELRVHLDSLIWKRRKKSQPRLH
jgi:hypothetical protein